MIARYKLTNHSTITAILVGMIATALCFQNILFYIHPSVTMVVLLAVLPLVTTVDRNCKSMRFAWWSVVFVALYFTFKMQLLYFLGFFSFLVFLIEANIGRVNSLPIFIILLLSPYTDFVFNTFGFPLRLQITELATTLLSYVYSDATSVGNNIVINKRSFSVDSACMGLTMVGYGYMMTLVFLGHFSRRYEKRIPLLKTMLILLLTTFFIVVVNLLRIVTIVVLQAPPETVLHEAIGLISFGVYLILPLYFIVRYLMQNQKSHPINLRRRKTPSLRMKVLLTFLLLSSLAYLNFHRSAYRHLIVDQESEQIVLPGFEKTMVENNVIKFQNDDALIYIKPAAAFYAPDHSPTICWRGSGYDFKNIEIKNINGRDIYTARLVKDDDILYTSWWFDNGEDKTVSQLHWRRSAAMGSMPYRLINVTTTQEEGLERLIGDGMWFDVF